jgi:uncharacterized hydrophobic protein (TIGR00271 family)
MSVPTQLAGDRQWRLQTWLRIETSAKPQIYGQVFATTEINSLSYWLEIFFSAGIATLGLVENSPAVIIGAMLISPLMGPIMATGLALAVGDMYLGIKAVLNLIVSIAVSIGFSALLVWLLPFHSATAEIIARTKPNLLDLGIALLSGLAGSVVVCRGGGGGVTLPGVAIAVALMPPLCTMGFGLGSGADFTIMGGAGLLFLTNLVAIVATAFLVFLLVGMGAPVVEEAMLASREDQPLARRIYQGPVARFMAAGGHLRWRILMVAILLAAIAVPLRRALLQVASETITRGAVLDDLRPLLRSGEVVSQQISLGDKEIIIRLLSTGRIPESEITTIRDDLMRRTGRNVQLSVDAVASKSELADLMERLARPAPAVIAKPKTFAELQQELIAQVQPAIQEIWPSADAPIQSFDVVSGPTGTVVEVRYQAAADLGQVPLNMVQQNVRTKLGMPDLTLKAQRVPPPGAPASPHKKASKRKR